ncbi:hypothetical protein [Burkholderia sp. NLJ2]|uniref:hypothetical protein n=1 Tax=Burkholderia sp. NLJ2 TaxID=3090699 RepID=UPI003C6C22D3
MIGVMSIRLLSGFDLHTRANQYTLAAIATQLALAAIATQLAFAALARLSGQTRGNACVAGTFTRRGA